MAQAEHAKQRRDMIMKQSQQSQQIDSLQLQHDFDIRIGHIKIINANHCRYLGVYIDKDLKWIEHINQLCNKLQKYAGIFYRLRQRLPDKCLKSIYFAFVYPRLLHGIEVYANTRSTHLSKLITLNSEILRILQNKPYRFPVKDLYTYSI